MHLELCDGTYTNMVLNFTSKDSQTLERLNFTFDTTLDFWAGTGDTKRTVSFSNSSTSEINLCALPGSTNLYLEGMVEYGYANNDTTYNTKTYLFESDVINNDTLQHITLFLLESDESTSFIQFVTENQIPVENALIKTYRYYPGTDSWEITQITTTSSDGKTVCFYKTETVDYRHEIFLDNVLRLNETSGRKIFGETTPFTLTFEISTEKEVIPSPILISNDLTTSITFNEDTEIVSYSYVDLNSSFNNARFLVTLRKI